MPGPAHSFHAIAFLESLSPREPAPASPSLPRFHGSEKEPR